MNLNEDTGVSTQINEGFYVGSNPSTLEQKATLRGFRTWPLLAMMCAIPTSVNIQITQPHISMNQTCLASGWRSSREEGIFEAEIYAPFQSDYWEEISPIRIPIARYVQARVVFLGPLTLRPLTDEI